ncbi:MAG: tRNA lysidine(34) synthetase TilS [Sphingomonadales bacterium]|jgi:tRNA(Ile)-lysidine synthase
MPGASARRPSALRDRPRLTGPAALPDLIAAALGRPVAADDRLAIAVSGGPDSTALLHLAALAFPARVTALTVDHRLRPESAAEAAAVAAQCAVRGISHATLRRDGPAIAANLQAEARAARYALLADWCAAHGHGLLLTAHHADDQAETLLMRLNRASASAGLAGIRACRPLASGVMLVRPLLGERKVDLAAFAAGWQTVDDPSNRDPRHDRTGVRTLLADARLDVAALARSAAHLAADAEALAWAADLAWAGRVRRDGAALLVDVGGLPQALTLRLLTRAIAALSGHTPRGGDVARLAARLGAGQSATLAGIRAQSGPIWRLSAARPPQLRTKTGRNATNLGSE